MHNHELQEVRSAVRHWLASRGSERDLDSITESVLLSNARAVGLQIVAGSYTFRWLAGNSQLIRTEPGQRPVAMDWKRPEPAQRAA